jgi:hypothetical protein
MLRTTAPVEAGNIATIPAADAKRGRIRSRSRHGSSTPRPATTLAALAPQEPVVDAAGSQKTTATITSARRKVRLAVPNGSPVRFQVKGNWGGPAPVAVEVTTRSLSADGMRFATVLTRNVAFNLPPGTTEVVLSTIRPAAGVSLDVTLEPFGALQSPELPKMRHERFAASGNGRGSTRPGRSRAVATVSESTPQ